MVMAVEGLVSGAELDKVYKERSRAYTIKKIDRDEVDEAKLVEKYGRENVIPLKTQFKCLIPKEEWQKFEDEVWCTLYELGFTEMNKDRKCLVTRDEDGVNKNQVDVFARVNNFICVVECKTSEKNKIQLKEKIDKFVSIRADSQKAIYDQFKQSSDDRIEDTWIMATNLTEYEKGTKEHLRNSRIYLIDDWKYYRRLSKILGHAAKYQFFANIYKNREIKSLSRDVYAIRGKMGSFTYYQFSITPDELMKIAFVPHANTSDAEHEDYYQRLVKPGRLKSISEYITSEGGLFPTNIVIGLSIGDKELQFSQSSPKTNGITPGVLKIPGQFGCANIIDGQHRLFSYAGLKEASTELLPVIAFEKMDIDEQSKLFIKINGEQQKVSKNLLNQIVCKQNWGSDNKIKRFYALPLMTIYRMNNDIESPLHNKIKMESGTLGGNVSTTFAELSDKMRELKLYGYKQKRSEPHYRLLFTDDFESSLDFGVSVLNEYFRYFINNSVVFEEGWKKGYTGFFSTNSMVVPLLGVFKAILEHISNKGILSTKKEEVIQAIEPYQQILCEYFDTAGIGEQLTSSGAGKQGYAKREDLMIEAINKKYRNFEEERMETISKRRVTEQGDGVVNIHDSEVDAILELEKKLRFVVKTVLMKIYGNESDMWWNQGVPEKIRTEAMVLAAKDGASSGFINYLYIVSVKDIVLQTAVFNSFSPVIDLNGDTSITKEKRVSWIKEISDVRNAVVHGRPIDDSKKESARSNIKKFDVNFEKYVDENELQADWEEFNTYR